MSENCPLCEKTASFEFRDAGKRKWFQCNTCRSFIITDTAERRLVKSLEWRKQLSELSASLAGNELLHIFVPTTPPGENNQDAIERKVELKTNWTK